MSADSVALVRADTALPSPPEAAAGDRFWSAVKKTASCWLWTGVRKGSMVAQGQGYGQFKFGGRAYTAHRVAYEWLVGPVPEGLVLDHLCRVQHCVNPAHLEAVDERVNILRGTGTAAACAAKTHCLRGHPFDAGNTGSQGTKGGRTCLACRREAYAAHKDKERAAHRRSYQAHREARLQAMRTYAECRRRKEGTP